MRPSGSRPDLDPGARPGADRARARGGRAAPPRRPLAVERRRAPHRPRGEARPRLRSARTAGGASAPTGATPAPTARPSSSRTGESPRATTRRSPGCSPRRAGPRGSRPRAPGSKPTCVRTTPHCQLGPPPARSASTSSATRPRRRGCGRSYARPAGRLSSPSGPTGIGRAATSTSIRTDVEDDWRGYRDNELPLDAIVIDSPWETQYNTWRFNPHQFPDAPGLVRGMREDGVRTVVWVTPWVNLESIDGQRPPDAASEKLHREPAENYAEGAEAGHYVRAADGEPYVGRWWMGTGSIVDFTSDAAREWWRGLARNVFELGVEGVKADDGEGYYFPPDSRLADGRTRRRGRLGVRSALPRDHPGGSRRGSRRRPRGRLRALGLDRPAGGGDALGRRPGLRLLVDAGAARLAADRRRQLASPTSPTTSAATSAGGWPSAASPSSWSAGPSSGRSRR